MEEADICDLITESDEDSICAPFWVQPRASKTKISGIYQDCLKISLTSPPVDGKANAELCKFISKKLSVPKSCIKIISGETSRKKILRISGIKKKKFAEALIV